MNDRNKPIGNVVNFSDWLKHLPKPDPQTEESFREGSGPMEVEAPSLMAAASVAYQTGRAGTADALIALYRAQGFPQWVLCPRDLVDFVLGVDLRKAIP